MGNSALDRHYTINLYRKGSLSDGVLVLQPFIRPAVSQGKNKTGL